MQNIRVINSMDENRPFKAKIHSVVQEVSRLLWNPNAIILFASANHWISSCTKRI
jgi:uncharacterized protein YjiK